ncbi:hypothetical protein H072_11336 [Dactylellina haptotyla CBS 200.50]|uniref:F-box domain-containing protein n=1 Tax=Dactylellina haptotyla (strain CBS 200.50) TaxID=1284197 RepID=S8B8F8_DACHA|nr:hypothetical protein H072_11336 [Dactylellina haptotyla CBS 200.50]
MAQMCIQGPVPVLRWDVDGVPAVDVIAPTAPETTEVTTPTTPSTTPSHSHLANLPDDIVYEICDHLSNNEILNLQLVSSSIRHKLSHRILDAIHSHKTYFLCQDGIKKLERIARIPSLAKRVTHITFDLESPYVGLLKRYWCIGTAMRYPQETRFKMQRWYHNHMRRRLAMQAARSRAGKTKDRNARITQLRRILRRFFSPGHASTLLSDTASTNSLKELDATDPESTNYEDAFHEIFTLFEVHLTSLYSQWQSKADILECITSAFRSLPNLQVLEFIRTDITKEDPSVMLSIWRQYNPELAWLLNSNPEIEDGDLPWTDWFTREALHSHLWEAYPSVLFCAAQAKRRIREVRIGSLSMEYPKAGAMISFFEPYHARISDTTGGQATEEELRGWIERHLEGYSYTFAGLRRLELCLDEKERESYHTNYFEASPLFLETVRNVEELVVWRMPSEVRRERSMEFVVPAGTKMEKLRRLEMGATGSTVNGLVEFIRTNSDSLREVVCQEDTFTANVMEKEDIMRVLETLRDEADLEVFEADFLVGSQEQRLVDEKKYYLSIKITGNWKDLSFCEFEIGIKHCHRWIAEDKESLQTHWVKKNSWEEFTNYIMETDVEDFFKPR